MTWSGWLLLPAALLAIAMQPASAAEADDAGLAQELTNPLADLMTIPIQMYIDRDIGPSDQGTKVTTNVQPVVPFDVSEDWNLITRTIVPVISQDDVASRARARSSAWATSMRRSSSRRSGPVSTA